MDQNSKSMN